MEGIVFKILVVDDEPNIRLGSERILKGTGFEVSTADSGEKGLELLGQAHFDIMLLDLMMPGMGGMEVLQRVSASHPELIVIVITGFATLETAVEAMKLGAYDFIAKPFQPDQLRIVVSRASEKLRLKAEHRRLAEERLQNLRDIDREKTRTRAIVQSMSEGVVLTDCDGSVVLSNPAAKKLLSFDHTPIPSASVDRFITDSALRDLVLSVCTYEGDQTEEIRTQEVQLDDGTWLLAKVTSVVTDGGRETGALTVLSDITAHKDLAELKSEFVAMVSHELRSPLAAMNQQLSVVHSDLAGEEHAENRRRIGRVRERTKGLLGLIADLLDISRIELGVLERHCEEVDAVGTLNHVADMFKDKMAENSITLNVNLPAQPVPMRTDPRELESIYVNLLSNAIKYTPAGGSVTVKGAAENGVFSASFRDTGIGIAPEEQERIFEKFYRVKSSETRMVVGSGLGLPIVQSIIDAHGGTVHVDSEAGEGTTFTVELPIEHPECDRTA